MEKLHWKYILTSSEPLACGVPRGEHSRGHSRRESGCGNGPIPSGSIGIMPPDRSAWIWNDGELEEVKLD